jgi:beta-phosphoglucomutase
MDGVIVDNHIYHVKAWAEFCKKYNIPFEEGSFRKRYFGKNNKDILGGLMGNHLTSSQVDLLGEEKEKFYRDVYQYSIAPVSGLVPFLQSLRESGVSTAVATSAPTSNLDFTLDNLHIRHFFDVIVDVTGIKNGKPDPEIYLKASKLLGIPPSECIVFEDSVSGIQAGQNAGMRVIALTTTHSSHELPKTPLAIKDFTEVSIEKIDDKVQ